MRLSLRLILFLVVGISLVTFFIARNQVRSEKRGLRVDLQRRAEILAESLQEIIEPALQKSSSARLRPIVEHYANKQQLAGVVIYDEHGKVLAESSTLVTRLTTPPVPLDEIKAGSPGVSRFLTLGGKPMNAYYVPLHRDGDIAGVLAIFHDASYIEAQSDAIWRDTIWHVVAQVLLIVLITVAIIRWTIILPISRTAQWMKDLRVGRAGPRPNLPAEDFLAPFSQEVVNLAQEPQRSARLRGRGSAPARNGRINVDRRAAAREHSEQARSDRCSWSPTASPTCTCTGGKNHRVACARQRLGDRAGTDSSRLRRHLDRSGSGDADREYRGRPRPPARAAGPSGVHAAPRLAHEGRRAGLLLRILERRALAALPHRAHAPDFPRRGLAELPACEPQICRRRARGNGRAPSTRWCWCRTITSRCCRA